MEMSKNGTVRTPYTQLAAFLEGSDEVHAVIETPRGSPNKYKYDPGIGVFILHSILPVGMAYPYDYGFVPSTLGEDGDPVDILVLMEQPTYAGCVVNVRLVGVLLAEQTEEDGKTLRNDRLIGIATASLEHQNIHKLDDLDPKLLEDINHFFVAYEETRGKKYIPRGQGSPAMAVELVEDGEALLRKKQK